MKYIAVVVVVIVVVAFSVLFLWRPQSHLRTGGADYGGYIGTNGQLLAGVGFDGLWFVGNKVRKISVADLKTSPTALDDLVPQTDSGAPLLTPQLLKCHLLPPPADLPAALCELPDGDPADFCAPRGIPGAPNSLTGRRVVVVDGHWDNGGTFRDDGVTVTISCARAESRPDLDVRGIIAKCATPNDNKKDEGWNLRESSVMLQTCVRAVAGDVCGKLSQRREPGDTLDIRDRANRNDGGIDCSLQPGELAFEAVWDDKGVVCVSQQFQQVMTAAAASGSSMGCLNSNLTQSAPDWKADGTGTICAHGEDTDKKYLVTRPHRFQFAKGDWAAKGEWAPGSHAADPYCDDKHNPKGSAKNHEK